MLEALRRAQRVCLGEVKALFVSSGEAYLRRAHTSNTGCHYKREGRRIYVLMIKVPRSTRGILSG